MLYDSIIIGTGPAGVSAALNLKILDKNFLWFGSGASSKKVEAAELIRNYPGLPDISGVELSSALVSHAKSMGIEPRHEIVTAIYDLGGRYAVTAGTDTLFFSAYYPARKTSGGSRRDRAIYHCRITFSESMSCRTLPAWGKLLSA